MDFFFEGPFLGKIFFSPPRVIGWHLSLHVLAVKYWVSIPAVQYRGGTVCVVSWPGLWAAWLHEHMYMHTVCECVWYYWVGLGRVWFSGE